MLETTGNGTVVVWLVVAFASSRTCLVSSACDNRVEDCLVLDLYDHRHGGRSSRIQDSLIAADAYHASAACCARTLAGLSHQNVRERQTGNCPGTAGCSNTRLSICKRGACWNILDRESSIEGWIGDAGDGDALADVQSMRAARGNCNDARSHIARCAASNNRGANRGQSVGD